MGWAKRMMDEYEMNGYSPPAEDKFLCADLYEDYYLKRYIKEKGSIGRCSYTNKKTTVISLAKFIEYIMQKISSYFTSPENDNLYYTSSFFDDEDEKIPGLKKFCNYVTREESLTFESKEDLFQYIDLISDNENVNNDILECIHNDKWIQIDSVVRLLNEELSDTWKQFAEIVKHKRRYTFYTLPENDSSYFSSENGLQDILSEISGAVNLLDLYKEIPEKTVLYRCRNTDSIEKELSFNDLTSPPDDLAKENRMNPKGISMFYGAFTKETAISEARDSEKSKCILGEFYTKKDLFVLDLTILPPKSFWHDYWQELAFIHSFRAEISKAVNDEHNSYEYVPTQIFAEYIRFCCKDKSGRSIDGIKFNSTKSSGTNIVLFYNQENSVNILQLEKYDIIDKSDGCS